MLSDSHNLVKITDQKILMYIQFFKIHSICQLHDTSNKKNLGFHAVISVLESKPISIEFLVLFNFVGDLNGHQYLIPCQIKDTSCKSNFGCSPVCTTKDHQYQMKGSLYTISLFIIPHYVRNVLLGLQHNSQWFKQNCIYIIRKRLNFNYSCSKSVSVSFCKRSKTHYQSSDLWKLYILPSHHTSSRNSKGHLTWLKGNKCLMYTSDVMYDEFNSQSQPHSVNIPKTYINN